MWLFSLFSFHCLSVSFSSSLFKFDFSGGIAWLIWVRGSWLFVNLFFFKQICSRSRVKAVDSVFHLILIQAFTLADWPATDSTHLPRLNSRTTVWEKYILGLVNGDHPRPFDMLLLCSAFAMPLSSSQAGPYWSSIEFCSSETGRGRGTLCLGLTLVV